MSCSFCQSDNPSSAEFCRACGAELLLLNGGADANIGANASAVASADALPVGTLLAGVYAVERVLGQGGFGITYGCHDQMLDRRVAIKEFFPSGCGRQDATVRPSRGVSETHFGEARAQFLAEARLLARCHHAGIVGVHTAFEANSTAYMVMELLHGSSLDRLTEARGGRLSESEAVRLTERAGEALQFVHDQGLLHRDIKPENIIATDDGRVMLIDFGTAREYAQGQAQGQAQGHTIVVTPGYAPLEQYARQAKRGAFTDVYGLAATLYHLLTGAAPPAASDRAVGVMLRPVREENAQISTGVANAIEAGLEMEIAKRPQSVREFLELMHAPQKTVFVADAAFQVALAPQKSAISQESATLEESAISPVQRDALRSLSHTPANFFSGAIQARQQLLEGAISQSPPVQLVSPSVPPSAMASSVLTSSAPTADPYSVDGGFITQNTGTMDDSAKAVCWSIGVIFVVFGVILALATAIDSRKSSSYPSSYSSSPSYSSSTNDSSPSYQPSTSSPAPVTRNSAAETARQEMESTPAILPASVEMLPVDPKLPTVKEGATPYYLRSGMAQFSPDGQRVAYVDNQAVVRVWSLAKHQVVRSFPEMRSNPPVTLLFSPDGEKLVVGYENQSRGKSTEQMRLWDIRTGKALGSLSANPQKDLFYAQVVLPDGKVLIHHLIVSASSNQRSVDSNLLWDPATGKQSATPLWDKVKSTTVDFSPDGKQFVTGDKAGHTRWLDARTGKERADYLSKQTYQNFQNSNFYQQNIPGGTDLNDPLPVNAVRFSHDGSAVASLNLMGFTVFNSKAQPIGQIATAHSPIFDVSRDGKWVIEGGSWNTSDRRMLWNMRSKQKIRLQAPVEGSNALIFSPDAKQVFGISTTGGRLSLITWNIDAKPIAPFSAPQINLLSGGSTALATAVSPTSQLLATLTSNSIEIRQLDGTLTQNIYTGYLNGRGVALSIDGASVAAELDNGAVQIWDVQTTQKKSQLEPIKSSQGAVPSNIAEGVTGQVRFTPPKRLIFSPDNNFLAHLRTTEGKNWVELWSLQGTPRPIGAIALSEPATALTFSSDNRGLICGGKSGAVRWYDVATQKLVGQTGVWSGPVSNLLVSSQGLTVVENSAIGEKVTVYEVQPKVEPKRGKVAVNSALNDFFHQKSQVSLHGIDNGASFSSIRQYLGSGNAPMLSPDGQFLAAVEPFIVPNTLNMKEDRLNIWHLGTGALVQQLQIDPGNDFSSVTPMFDPSQRDEVIAFSPDGNQIIYVRRAADRQPQMGRQIITWKRPDAQ